MMINNSNIGLVLTIDDEPVVRESIAAYLEDSGFTVIQAENGRIGLEVFRREQPDIVLVDLRMPEVDGLDVLATVTQEFPEIPVIVVSGTGVLQDAVEALRLGAWDYIIKPIQDMAILEHAVRNAMERSRLMIENRQYREHLEEQIRKRTQEFKKSEKRYCALFEDSPISLWEEDFSSLKEYIDELRQKGINDFRKYFDNNPEEVQKCTAMIHITDVNKATLDLFEAQDKSDLMGTLDRLLTQKSYSILKEQLIRIAMGRTFEFQSKGKTLKGKRLDIVIKSSIPPGYEESWAKVFVSVYDMTERIRAEKERKKLEVQLNQAQKMEALGTLAGGIAHDFNNILFPIFGYTEMALDRIAKNEELYKQEPIRRYLESIFDAANRAKDLVSQILTFSRRHSEERKPLRIQPIIKESLKLLRATLPSTIEIRHEIIPDCGIVLANPTHIHQVIMNLCTNAYHAMRNKGGILEVRLEPIDMKSDNIGFFSDIKPGLYLKLTVSDTGHGMTEDIKGKIFDPYFTTKEVGEGTGLGLSVVLGIVKAHEGYIRVYSEPGQGTTFHIYFPQIEVDGEYHQEHDIKSPVPGGDERILLVDDEKQIIEMEKQMLEQLGYRVTAINGGVEAIAEFQRNSDEFDLVITDMTMPKMTGINLSKEILKIQPNIPIILCTGFSELVTEEKAKAAGIREFIMKPVHRAQIAQIIRRVLDGSKVTTSL